MQTLVYPYVLAEAGEAVTGGAPVAPRQITLVYWFASGQPEERFAYGVRAHAEAGGRLRALIDEIAERDIAVWPLTDSDQDCAYCPYGTLCEREGVEGEPPTEWDPEGQESGDPFAIDLDLEQVAEIEF
jgi:hypothetical protein